jgi:type IV pilus assembly protein PilC
MSSFEQLAKRLAELLESGESLANSLRIVPEVACREVRLAAAVGEATGALGPCLKDVSRERWSAAWMEVIPRFLYPFFVLQIVFGVVSFLSITIIPRYKRIFDEFGMSLPVITLTLTDSSVWFADYSPLIQPATILLILTGIALVIASPTVRWHTPLLGRLYRWGVQGEVLRSLGRFLTVGQTVPAALAFMIESRVFPPVVQRRLRVVETAIGRGELLETALRQAGLLPASMVPLVSSATRVGNLPWALVELGDHLSGRAFRLVRQLSLVLSPILVVVIGAVVLFVVVALFLPLIKLLEGLAK